MFEHAQLPSYPTSCTRHLDVDNLVSTVHVFFCFAVDDSKCGTFTGSTPPLPSTAAARETRSSPYWAHILLAQERTPFIAKFPAQLSRPFSEDDRQPKYPPLLQELSLCAAPEAREASARSSRLSQQSLLLQPGSPPQILSR